MKWRTKVVITAALVVVVGAAVMANVTIVRVRTERVTRASERAMWEAQLEQTPPTPIQAVNILAQAAAAYEGNLRDHVHIQAAVQVLRVALTPAVEAVAPVADEAPGDGEVTGEG